MFCPNCKAILERVRTAYGIQEFCNCPGKKRSEFFSELNKKKWELAKQQNRISSASTIPERKARTRRGKSTESIHIPVKKKPSDYIEIPLHTRLISANTKLPINWDKGRVGELLKNRLDDMYERFYRKFEDFFINKKTELRFVVFLEPSPHMNEFKVFRWGIGSFEKELENEWTLIRWYQGSKLPLDWSAKVREKEGDYLTPILHFPQSKRTDKLGKMNYLPQIEWFSKLIDFWNDYKEINNKKSYKIPKMDELYKKWRGML